MTSRRSTFQNDAFAIAAKSPHFCRIILDDTNSEQKLEIPYGFVKKYGDGLSSPIILKVPTGESWEVELLKNGDQIWLENGWQEFSDYHCLKHGHLLLFELEGESHFHICIFDMSAVEVKYRNNETEEDDVSCQILDDSTGDDGVKVEDSYCGTLKHSIGDKSRKASRSKTSGALEAANNFISNNPFFKIVFRDERFVKVPFGFIQRNMNPQTRTKTVMLQVADKSWPVKLSVYPNNYSARLGLGWPAFASENSLQSRDVCIFELTKRNVLLVSIYKYGV